MKNLKILLMYSLIVMSLFGCAKNETNIKNDAKSQESDVILNDESELNQYENIEEEVIVEEIHQKQEAGIRLELNEMKTKYGLGENVEIDKLEVYLVYDDNTEELLNEEKYSISEIDTSKYGTSEISITYNEFIEKISIEVVYTVNPVEEKTKYASTSLNLRSGPGTNFEKLTSIGLNTAVKIIGEVDNGWLKIIYKDKEYFCSSKYLMNEKKVIETQTINVSTANAPTASTSNNQSTSNSYDNRVIGEPGSSSSIVNSANSYWNSTVPNWLKQKFINSGWNIAISGTSLAARYGYGMSIAGITDYGARMIYIDNRQSPVKRSMLHELGHFIDHSYGYPSGSNEFRQIFEAEKYSFIDCTAVGDGHETSNIMEYFASVFQNAIINGANCQRQAPRSYEFVCRYMH